MAKLALLSGNTTLSTTESDAILSLLCDATRGETLDWFGWCFVADDRVFSLVPWDSHENPPDRPLLFVDESYDAQHQLTLYAGLLVSRATAFTLAGWYLGNLVATKRHVPSFWPETEPPPRLHFREMFSEDARRKTSWSHLSTESIMSLVRVVADALGSSDQVFPFVVRIPDRELDKGVRAAFPGGVDDRAIPDIAGQIIAHALSRTIADRTRRGLDIDLVVDHNATKIYLGRIQDSENQLSVGGRRQATLRFIDGIKAVATDPLLVADATARDSSGFPSDFTWHRLTKSGYSFSDIVKSIGLQFADLYVNSWRHLEQGAYPQLDLRRTILKRATSVDFVWNPPSPPLPPTHPPNRA
jgi:hypothetical protein